jgi:hypothetical protein
MKVVILAGRFSQAIDIVTNTGQERVLYRKYCDTSHPHYVHGGESVPTTRLITAVTHTAENSIEE